MKDILSVQGVDVYYGAVQALSNVSMHVGEKEIIALIGSNGAGKSTLMKAIMGLTPPSKGTIEMDGKVISGMPTDKIVSQGIIYIPEGREVFPNMTVLENLEMGAYSKPYKAERMQAKLDEMYTIFPRLQERKSQKAGSLSGGEQQMLAIARGLMSEPKLLMCDEPSLGLAPVIVDEMFDVITLVNKQSEIPIIVVEQNAYMALSISQRCYILENGEMRLEGKSKELMVSSAIKSAYLGG